MKAIFLFDYTGIMAEPWLDAGYECWCFDGQHEPGITREGNHVKVGMWFDAYEINNHADDIIKMVGDGVVHVFGFPECTQLAVSGAAHFASKQESNPLFQWEAMQFVYMCRLVGVLSGASWCLENPVSVISSKWRKPDHSFHPYEFGGYLPKDDAHPSYPEYIAPRDAYPKKTCLWCGGGYVMPKLMPVDPEPGFSRQHKKLGGRSIKTKNIRSATPRGFALANYIANRKELGGVQLALC